MEYFIEYSTEYSIDNSMEYENVKNEYSTKTPETSKILKFMEYRIFQEYSKI